MPYKIAVIGTDSFNWIQNICIHIYNKLLPKVPYVFLRIILSKFHSFTTSCDYIHVTSCCKKYEQTTDDPLLQGFWISKILIIYASECAHEGTGLGLFCEVPLKFLNDTIIQNPILWHGDFTRFYYLTSYHWANIGPDSSTHGHILNSLHALSHSNTVSFWTHIGSWMYLYIMLIHDYQINGNMNSVPISGIYIIFSYSHLCVIGNYYRLYSICYITKLDAIILSCCSIYVCCSTFELVSVLFPSAGAACVSACNFLHHMFPSCLRLPGELYFVGSSPPCVYSIIW